MNDMSPVHRSARETYLPLRIAVLYAFVGGVWILSSDRLLALLVRDPQLANRLQTFKGWFYVLVTTILIYILVKRDIVVISRVEWALRESEARLQSIFRAAPIGIGVVSNRALLHVNGRICEMTGYTSQELIGKSARLLYPTDRDFEYVDQEKYHQIQVWGTGTVKTRWQRKGGRIIDVLLNSAPLDPADLSAGVTFTALDITEQVWAEEALRESQRMLSTLMKNLPGMAYRCRNDQDWTMEFVSDGCFDLTGYHPADLVHNRTVSYAQLIHPDHRELGWSKVQAALQENRPFQRTYKIRTALGDEKWVWEQGRGVLSAEENTVIVEGFVTDVTARVWTEEALRESEIRYRELFDNIHSGVAESPSDL